MLQNCKMWHLIMVHTGTVTFTKIHKRVYEGSYMKRFCVPKTVLKSFTIFKTRRVNQCYLMITIKFTCCEISIQGRYASAIAFNLLHPRELILECYSCVIIPSAYEVCQMGYIVFVCSIHSSVRFSVGPSFHP